MTPSQKTKNEYVSTLFQTAHSDYNEYTYRLFFVNNLLVKYREYRHSVKLKQKIRRFNKTKNMGEDKKNKKLTKISISRSSKSIHDYVLANFSPNNYFYTLTYDQSKYPETLKKSYFEKAVQDWTAFKDSFFDWHFKFKQNPKYLAILEYYARKPHWHIHFLCSFRPFTKNDKKSYIEGCQKVQDIWGKGFIRVQRISSFNYWKYKGITPTASSLADYIAKYLTKSLELGAYPPNKKRYFASKNLIKPETIYTNLDPHNDRLAHLDGFKEKSLYTTNTFDTSYYGLITDYNLKTLK